MKRNILLLLFATVTIATISSCKKVISAIFPGIDARIPAFEVSVPAIPIVAPGEIDLGTYSLYFNLDSIIRANTANVFNVNDIESVKVKEVTVSVQNADNLNNLSNFDYARFTIASDNNPNEVDVTRIDFPEQQASSVTVTPENAPELVNYLRGTQLTFRVFGKQRKITTKPLTMRLSVTVRVE